MGYGIRVGRMHKLLSHGLPTVNRYLYGCIDRNLIMWKKIQEFYQEYKPYIFSDGWYYIFIVVFILVLFIFFS
ncbi:MAG: hypothetical protein BGO59_28070 [Spirosoma sp. 48-14]|nr:MAG: hypothetical protein BGO59_28070 [Spirosoma sp. 48-14]